MSSRTPLRVLPPPPLESAVSPCARQEYHSCAQPASPQCGTEAEWLAWNQRQLEAFTPKHVPASDRERYAKSNSLLTFYEHCQSGVWEAVGRKRDRSPYTLQKETQALRWFARFSRPDEWPLSREWRGPSLWLLEHASGEFWSAFYDRCAKDLSPGTVKALRSHLAAILNHAVKVGAILRWQSPKTTSSLETVTRIYTPAEVERVYAALSLLVGAGLPEGLKLRTAFVLALNSGLRSGDLFCLGWSDVKTDAAGRAYLAVTASKTSKLQGLPLPPLVLRHLELLRAATGGRWLFEGLSAPEAADPEGSWAARYRNRLLRSIFEGQGIRDVTCPIHCCRSTFNERMESHAPGVGKWLLGHDCRDVNSTHYRNPNEAVWRAVLSFPQYPCFETV